MRAERGKGSRSLSSDGRAQALAKAPQRAAATRTTTAAAAAATTRTTKSSSTTTRAVAATTYVRLLIFEIIPMPTFQYSYEWGDGAAMPEASINLFSRISGSLLGGKASSCKTD